MKVIEFKTPKLSVREVWIGYYWDHCNVIVIFKEKPVKGTEEKGVYNTYDNKKKIAGTIGMDQFMDLFPDLNISSIRDKESGHVRDMETQKLIHCSLNAPFDEDGILETIDFHSDGY